MSNVTSIYNRPDIYDVHFNSKQSKQLRGHYEVVLKDKHINMIHDCSYGTGNLTNELARMGFQVSGSDISEDMLIQSEMKLKEEGLALKLTQCDFRELSKKIDQQFDCVMTTGNSLAHVSNSDVKLVLSEMAKLVKENGYIYIDTRNWDKILSTGQRFYYYPPIINDDERINAMQVWDYNNDSTITFNILYYFEREGQIYKKEEFKELYFPLKRQFIIDELARLGFGGFELYNLVHHHIKDFDKMGWYCIIAQKNGC